MVSLFVCSAILQAVVAGAHAAVAIQVMGGATQVRGSSADAERITDAKCSTTRACNIASRYITSAPRAIAQPLVRRHTYEHPECSKLATSNGFPNNSTGTCIGVGTMSVTKAM